MEEQANTITLTHKQGDSKESAERVTPPTHGQIRNATVPDIDGDRGSEFSRDDIESLASDGPAVVASGDDATADVSGCGEPSSTDCGTTSTTACNAATLTERLTKLSFGDSGINVAGFSDEYVEDSVGDSSRDSNGESFSDDSFEYFMKAFEKFSERDFDENVEEKQKGDISNAEYIGKETRKSRRDKMEELGVDEENNGGGDGNEPIKDDAGTTHLQVLEYHRDSKHDTNNNKDDELLDKSDNSVKEETTKDEEKGRNKTAREPIYSEKTHSRFFNYFDRALNSDNPHHCLLAQTYSRRDVDKWFHHVDRHHARAHTDGACSHLMVDGRVDYTRVDNDSYVPGTDARGPIVNGMYVDAEEEDEDQILGVVADNSFLKCQTQNRRIKGRVADGKLGGEAPASSLEDAPALLPENAPALLPENAPALLPENAPAVLPEDAPSVLPEDVYADFLLDYTTTIEASAIKSKFLRDEFIENARRRQAKHFFNKRYPFTDNRVKYRRPGGCEMTQSAAAAGDDSKYLRQTMSYGDAKWRSGDQVKKRSNIHKCQFPRGCDRTQEQIDQNNQNSNSQSRRPDYNMEKPDSQRDTNQNRSDHQSDTKSVFSLNTFKFIGLLIAVAVVSYLSFRKCSVKSRFAMSDELGPVTSHAVMGNLSRARRDDTGVIAYHYKRDKNGNDCIAHAGYYYMEDFLKGSGMPAAAKSFIHVLLCMYMLVGVGHVVYHYYVPAVLNICERLGLKSNVAGATFMAAGTSVPELITNIVGVHIARSDIGLGSVVGSSIFNMLFILALTGLFCTYIIQMSWYPVSRDSFFYITSVMMLFAVCWNESISIADGVILLLWYIVYIAFIVCDHIVKIEVWIKCKLQLEVASDEQRENTLKMIAQRRHSRFSEELSHVDVGMLRSSVDSLKELGMSEEQAKKLLRRHFPVSHWSKDVTLAPRSDTLDTADVLDTPPDKQAPPTSAVSPQAPVSKNPSNTSGPNMSKSTEGAEHVNATDKATLGESQSHLVIDPSLNVDTYLEAKLERGEIRKHKNPFQPPKKKLNLVYWIIAMPFIVLHFITIPDSRKVGTWQHSLYILSYIISIIYFSIYCYIMIWMIALIGDQWGVPEVMLSLSLVSAGTGIPELMTSILVARDGYGDMAVSSALGSNIFNHLVVVGMPYLTADMNQSGKADRTIHSQGLLYVVALLVVMVIYLLSVLKWNRWRLDRKVSIVTFVMYLLMMTISNLLMTNLFGSLNVPACEREDG